MSKLGILKSALIGGASAAVLTTAAAAHDFNIPAGDLGAALHAFTSQAGVALVVSGDAVRGVRTHGAKGDLSSEAALSHILADTGFKAQQDSGVIAIVRDEPSKQSGESPVRLTQIADSVTPAHAASSVETVVVTSSKIKGDIQTVPIAITALSQEQLTSRQIAGGPDLVKEVPNLTFSKTNFTGYNIQIRGIGTQAISVATDPAVAVALNDIPFIRNHFFEQEFYDVSQVEVLRGPQGTLYGRNATAGVVNVVSAVPTDQFEAMLSADWGNYSNRRYEGMVNIPIVDDRLDLRVAGEWTKRDGYSFNSLTNAPIDGRDLWSSRTTLRWHPGGKFTADLIWEHFQESDDRIRSGKQLCKRGAPPESILGISTGSTSEVTNVSEAYLDQGCLPGSMYSPDAFGVPDSIMLPYYGGLINAGGAGGGVVDSPLPNINAPGGIRDAYAGTTQSHNLRVIESTLNPRYRANNDTLEFNTEWNIAPALTLNSQTAFNRDFLWSTEDFNRFNTQPGIFLYDPTGSAGWSVLTTPDGNNLCSDGYYAIGMTCDAAGHGGYSQPTGIFCDPQLGCSDRLVGEDLSEEHSWQLSQEFRLSSSFQGPFNFSVGANYMHYETFENYYVFFNTLTAYAATDGQFGRGNPPEPWIPGVSDNDLCISSGRPLANPKVPTSPLACLGYIDPNPISRLDNNGHNYFLSQNPYVLNSYAGFGEAYYSISKDLKLTGGLRWTDDKKHFIEIPSEVLTTGFGYPETGSIDQEWKEWTGRFVADWTPKLDFTDQTMIYGSFAHGYKAGGANPPGAVLLVYYASDITNPTHPLTFKPEFNDAFELGTKNTALDGGLTFNADVFYYNYKGYQISQIVDRTSINLNFDATVRGAEIQGTWEPLPGLKFAFAGGYEHTIMADGSKAIDLMDRTAGNPDWLVVKPFATQASNCVAPAYVVAYLLNQDFGTNNPVDLTSLCGEAYSSGHDPVTGRAYTAYPTGNTDLYGGAPIDPSYPGFDPQAGNISSDPYIGQNTFNGINYGPAPNNGTGFYKNLSGNELPNAPHFTASFSAEYTLPVSEDWAATLHSDFYWQSQSWARVFNDNPYDKIRGYSNVNLALILTSASGWQVMGYLKNVFDTTAITGDFLNSDDTGLTTNVFLTDPRLFGVRVTKNW
jgi:iron complex outermembrane receptor protein